MPGEPRKQSQQRTAVRDGLNRALAKAKHTRAEQVPRDGQVARGAKLDKVHHRVLRAHEREWSIGEGTATLDISLAEALKERARTQRSRRVQHGSDPARDPEAARRIVTRTGDISRMLEGAQA